MNNSELGDQEDEKFPGRGNNKCKDPGEGQGRAGNIPETRSSVAGSQTEWKEWDQMSLERPCRA